MATVTLRFSPLAAHVRTARLVAASVARRAGVEDVALDEVRLAVGEACSRAVGLHERHTADEPVEVRLSDDDSRFTVVVIDHGPADAEMASERLAAPRDLIDPEEVAAPAGAREPALPADLLPPGFGLAVIAGLVDDVTVVPISTNGGGTMVAMSWPVTPPSLPAQRG